MDILGLVDTRLAAGSTPVPEPLSRTIDFEVPLVTYRADDRIDSSKRGPYNLQTSSTCDLI